MPASGGATAATAAAAIADENGTPATLPTRPLFQFTGFFTLSPTSNRDSLGGSAATPGSLAPTSARAARTGSIQSPGQPFDSSPAAIAKLAKSTDVHWSTAPIEVLEIWLTELGADVVPLEQAPPGGGGTTTKSTPLAPGVTHVVRDGQPHDLKQSSKTIYAALSDRALVTREWIGACHAAGTLLPVPDASMMAGVAMGVSNPFVPGVLVFASNRFSGKQTNEPTKSKILRGLTRLGSSREVLSWPADATAEGGGAYGEGAGSAGCTRWLFVVESELSEVKQQLAGSSAGAQAYRLHTWKVRHIARAKPRPSLARALRSRVLTALPALPASFIETEVPGHASSNAGAAATPRTGAQPAARPPTVPPPLPAAGPHAVDENTQPEPTAEEHALPTPAREAMKRTLPDAEHGRATPRARRSDRSNFAANGHGAEDAAEQGFDYDRGGGGGAKISAKTVPPLNEAKGAPAKTALPNGKNKRSRNK
ncbi:hypothetical protein T492DRAFT_836719 [Pavlovales sp. CCMP2436]|nr:hypothetical protein T492DRAFT_836719 [Pavlovales sp. CCMP2436]